MDNLGILPGNVRVKGKGKEKEMVVGKVVKEAEEKEALEKDGKVEKEVVDGKAVKVVLEKVAEKDRFRLHATIAES